MATSLSLPPPYGCRGHLRSRPSQVRGLTPPGPPSQSDSLDPTPGADNSEDVAMTRTQTHPFRLHWAVGLVVLALLAVLLPAQRAAADHTPTPSAVTLVGSLQSELGCPGDWQPECAATHLEPVAGQPEVFRATFTVPAGSYEYKVALNGSWDENYGARRRSRRGQPPDHLDRRPDHLHLRPPHPSDQRRHPEAADLRLCRSLAAPRHDRLGPAGQPRRLHLSAVLGRRGRAGPGRTTRSPAGSRCR